MSSAKQPPEGRRLTPVGYARTDFPAKFGIPRQSGILDMLESEIILTGPFRHPDVFRGLEGFSHLWVLWDFSDIPDGKWSPTVRPPRLGGNERVGLFASRSPFRPNPIGLSCVRLVRVLPEDGKLIVAGLDVVDGTPVYDLKPYVPHTDCRPDATGGFSDAVKSNRLKAEADPSLLERLPDTKREALIRILEEDPRPAYQRDPGRVYGFPFAGFEIRFTADDGSNAIRLTDVLPLPAGKTAFKE